MATESGLLLKYGMLPFALQLPPHLQVQTSSHSAPLMGMAPGMYPAGLAPLPPMMDPRMLQQQMQQGMQQAMQQGMQQAHPDAMSRNAHSSGKPPARRQALFAWS